MKRDPFQGPRLDSSLTFVNELSKVTHVADKVRDCFGNEGLLCHVAAHSFRVYGDKVSFRAVSGQSF